MSESSITRACRRRVRPVSDTKPINVGVRDTQEEGRYWGARLINVVRVDGLWKAVVFDNFYEEIYVVDADDLREWGGEVV